MLPKASKKNFDEAMELLRKDFKEKSEKNLNGILKGAVVKVHPDKGGKQEFFKIVHPIYRSVTTFFDVKTKPSHKQVIELAKILRQLPPDISKILVNKIKEENPQYTNINLMNPVIHRVHNTYAHAAENPLRNRTHAFEVDSSKFRNLKEQFEGLKGDFLKTKILEDFKNQIENTSSKEELNELKEQIMRSPEYKVLNTGQGLFTKITGVKTSSATALDSMFAEQEQNISNPLTCSNG